MEPSADIAALQNWLTNRRRQSSRYVCLSEELCASGWESSVAMHGFALSHQRLAYLTNFPDLTEQPLCRVIGLKLCKHVRKKRKEEEDSQIDIDVVPT
jgi:hypothetical protein